MKQNNEEKENDKVNKLLRKKVKDMTWVNKINEEMNQNGIS